MTRTLVCAALLLLLGGAAGQSLAELPAVCQDAATYLPDTDLWDGDIMPTIAYEVSFDLKAWGREGNLFQDYVVSASDAESCCTQCWLHPDCGAWTWTEPSTCDEWLRNTTGCCYLKYPNGFNEATGPEKKGMVSGILPDTSAKTVGTCEVMPRQGLQGGDLTVDDALTSLVVPVGTAQACCNACASQPGCGAFTMAPSITCVDRLGAANPGCCYLKAASGWTLTKGNDTILLTSGRLVK